MHVLRNVKNISIWNIVNYVHKHVEDVQKNVVRWLDKQKKSKRLVMTNTSSILFSFPCFAVFFLSFFLCMLAILYYRLSIATCVCVFAPPISSACKAFMASLKCIFAAPSDRVLSASFIYPSAAALSPDSKAFMA
jgi:ABC-type proline/glycine betaine transport system permease subunit